MYIWILYICLLKFLYLHSFLLCTATAAQHFPSWWVKVYLTLSGREHCIGDYNIDITNCTCGVCYMWGWTRHGRSNERHYWLHYVKCRIQNICCCGQEDILASMSLIFFSLNLSLASAPMLLYCYFVPANTQWHQQPNILSWFEPSHSPALLLYFSLAEWAVFWLPAPRTPHHLPLAVLLPPLGWRCRQASGCLRSPQLYPRDRSRTQKNPLPNPGAFDECHRKCKGKWR